MGLFNIFKDDSLKRQEKVQSQIERLKKKLPQIEVHKNQIEKDVNTYKSFLENNLSYNIEQICDLQDDGGIQTISNISLPFRQLNIIFSIEFFNSNYKGEYTVWCPELRGCITQGKTKIEAFDNLLYAISEVLIINYDLLSNNPITFPNTPLPTHSQINFPKSLLSNNIDSEFTLNFIEEYGFYNVYIGTQHVIFKTDNPADASITILYSGINDLTKFCFNNIFIDLGF